MRLTYKCCFPNCTYETEDRSLIEFHHVHLRERGNRLGKDVTVPICPSHHKFIYHPEATAGQHSIMHDESLSIESVVKTTTGKAVVFRDVTGKDIVVTIDVRQPKPDTIWSVSWSLLGGISEAEVTECDSYAEQQVDAKGYCQVGNTVFYAPGNRHVALDLLKGFIAQYMIKTKSEYLDLLKKARADYRSLK